MMPTLLSLAWLACSPEAGIPEAAASRAFRASESLRDLRSASRTPVTLTARRGIPSAVFAQVPVEGREPVEAAYDFLERFSGFYGLDAPRDQLYPRSAGVRDGSHVRFVQRSSPEQGGLPLFDSGLTVHMADGVVYMTTGRYVPDRQRQRRRG